MPTPKGYILSEQDYKVLKELIHNAKLGTPAHQSQHQRKVKESYLVKTTEDIPAVDVDGSSYTPGAGTANLVKQDSTSTELIETENEVYVWNVGRVPVAEGSYIQVLRNPTDGQLYTIPQFDIAKIEFITDLTEGDSTSADAWLMEWDGTNWTRTDTQIEVYGDQGFRGVCFGRTGSVDQGDISDAYYSISGNRYYALTGATSFHGQWDADTTKGAEGTVTLYPGAGEDTREIQVDAYAFHQDLMADQLVYCYWNNFSRHWDCIWVPEFDDCYLVQDATSDLWTIDLESLIDPEGGLILNDDTSCPKIMIDCEYVQECVSSAGTVVAGDCPISVNVVPGDGSSTPDTYFVDLVLTEPSGLAVETDGTECIGLKVDVSDCHLYIEDNTSDPEYNKLKLDVESLAGPGLQLSDQTCDQLTVQATCNLEIDENNNLKVNRTNLCGPFLMPDPEDECGITLDMTAICEWLQENCDLGGGGAMGMNAMTLDITESIEIVIDEQASFGFGVGDSITAELGSNNAPRDQAIVFGENASAFWDESLAETLYGGDVPSAPSVTWDTPSNTNGDADSSFASITYVAVSSASVETSNFLEIEFDLGLESPQSGKQFNLYFGVEVFVQTDEGPWGNAGDLLSHVEWDGTGNVATGVVAWQPSWVGGEWYPVMDFTLSPFTVTEYNYNEKVILKLSSYQNGIDETSSPGGYYTIRIDAARLTMDTDCEVIV